MHLHIYFLTSSLSLLFIFYHRHVNVWLNSHSNGFVLWNSQIFLGFVTSLYITRHFTLIITLAVNSHIFAGTATMTKTKRRKYICCFHSKSTEFPHCLLSDPLRCLNIWWKMIASRCCWVDNRKHSDTVCHSVHTSSSRSRGYSSIISCYRLILYWI